MRSSQTFRPENFADPDGLIEAVSASAMPAAAADRVGRIIAASAGLSGLIGYSWRELAGMPLNMLWADRSFNALLPGGSMETALLASKGPPVPVRAYLSGSAELRLMAFQPISSEQRLAAELEALKAERDSREKYLEDFRSGVFRMISDLDRSETELRDTLRRLRQTQGQLIQSSKMSALGELAAGLAHEVSQPLTVILGLSKGMLRSLDKSSPEHEKASLVTEAAKRMDAIVRHLKMFARAEPPATAAVDINSVVKDAFLILGETLLSASIETVLELGAVPIVVGSPNRLEQAVVNLVTNARDAMPEGGVLRVSSGAVEKDGRLFARLTVRDTGGGIPDEVMERIFEPFVTTKAAGKGTGLGLSITSGIIREHNGEIRAESTPGSGAAFHITLPARDNSC